MFKTNKLKRAIVTIFSIGFILFAFITLFSAIATDTNLTISFDERLSEDKKQSEITINVTPVEGCTVTKIINPDMTISESIEKSTYIVSENNNYSFIITYIDAVGVTKEETFLYNVTDLGVIEETKEQEVKEPENSLLDTPLKDPVKTPEVVPQAPRTGNIAIDETNFPDDNFRAYILELFPSGEITPSNIAATTTINCSNRSINSFKGLQYFTSLQYFDASNTGINAPYDNMYVFLPASVVEVNGPNGSDFIFDLIYYNGKIFPNLKKIQVSTGMVQYYDSMPAQENFPVLEEMTLDAYSDDDTTVAFISFTGTGTRPLAPLKKLSLKTSLKNYLLCFIFDTVPSIGEFVLLDENTKDGIKSVDICNLNIQNETLFFDTLYELKNLEELSLYQFNIKELDTMKFAYSLNRISIRDLSIEKLVLKNDTRFSSQNFRETDCNVKYIDISGSTMDKLIGIGTSTETIIAKDNPILFSEKNAMNSGRLSVMMSGELTNLKYIDLSNSGYFSWPKSALTPKLEYANFSGMKFQGADFYHSIYAFPSSPVLKYLDFSGCKNDGERRSPLPKLQVDKWAYPALTQLDTTNSDIADIYIGNYIITDFKINSPSLKKLMIGSIPVNSVDTTALTGLEELEYYHNDTENVLDINSIDVSQNKNLKKFQVYHSSNLTTLDLSNNTLLESLSLVYNPQIANLTLPTNPVLKNVNLLGSTVLPSLDLRDATLLETLNVSKCASLTELNLEQCVNLERLDTTASPIEILNLNNCVKLKYIISEEMQRLVTLDAENCIGLLELSLANATSLTTLNIANCEKIQKLSLSGCTKINDLNLDKLTKLQYLYLSTVPIRELDISKMVDLEELSVFQTKIARLDASQNIKLSNISSSNMEELTYIDLSNTLIPGFNLISSTKLSDDNVKMKNMSNLKFINISGSTKLKALDVSEAPLLEEMRVSNLGLETLDLTNNPKLTKLYAANNNLTEVKMLDNYDHDVSVNLSFNELTSFKMFPTFKRFSEGSIIEGDTLVPTDKGGLDNNCISDLRLPDDFQDPNGVNTVGQRITVDLFNDGKLWYSKAQYPSWGTATCGTSDSMIFKPSIEPDARENGWFESKAGLTSEIESSPYDFVGLRKETGGDVSITGVVNFKLNSDISFSSSNGIITSSKAKTLTSMQDIVSLGFVSVNDGGDVSTVKSVVNSSFDKLIAGEIGEYDVEYSYGGFIVPRKVYVVDDSEAISNDGLFLIRGSGYKVSQSDVINGYFTKEMAVERANPTIFDANIGEFVDNTLFTISDSDYELLNESGNKTIKLLFDDTYRTIEKAIDIEVIRDFPDSLVTIPSRIDIEKIEGQGDLVGKKQSQIEVTDYTNGAVINKDIRIYSDAYVTLKHKDNEESEYKAVVYDESNKHYVNPLNELMVLNANGKRTGLFELRIYKENKIYEDGEYNGIMNFTIRYEK